jgi:hypothetical protein
MQRALDSTLYNRGTSKEGRGIGYNERDGLGYLIYTQNHVAYRKAGVHKRATWLPDLGPRTLGHCGTGASFTSGRFHRFQT